MLPLLLPYVAFALSLHHCCRCRCVYNEYLTRNSLRPLTFNLMGVILPFLAHMHTHIQLAQSEQNTHTQIHSIEWIRAKLFVFIDISGGCLAEPKNWMKLENNAIEGNESMKSSSFSDRNRNGEHQRAWFTWCPAFARFVSTVYSHSFQSIPLYYQSVPCLLLWMRANSREIWVNDMTIECACISEFICAQPGHPRQQSGWIAMKKGLQHFLFFFVLVVNG